MVLSRGHISGNTEPGPGGGLFLSTVPGTVVTINDCTISGNTAGGVGGIDNYVLPNPNGGPNYLGGECDIANTGRRDGAEIVQLYVHPEKSSVARPDKELKGFAKVFLKSGQKKTVAISLRADAFAFYDMTKGGWLSEAGDYSILVGASSRDIRLRDKWTLPQTIFAEEK